ncbi:SPOP [Mytilus coruscus]|uniref:SPOP n=1 Tax=Mytilus coruscus TaxID=42192 RepID=A0A6J8B233_MYTCO|nr:SPOP [Mytilus coruscus]
MNLPDCMMHMLKNEIMCDVTLRVGEGRSPIKAHKYMLASRSPVFHTMFDGSMPETGEIAIPDIEENTFNDILVETDVCQFLLKWTKAQCVSQGIESTGQNMRNLVGQTLYQIRFPVVDMDFFSKEIANTDFLSRDEIIAILSFPIYCESEGTEALIFQTDTDIWLRGVNLFPYDSYDTEITFKILDEINEEIIVHKTEIDWDYGCEERLIKLPKLVQILSGKEYTITTQNYRNNMYYGIDCNHSDKASDCPVSITFKNSPMCTGISNVDQGQFAGFTFSV